MTIDDLPSDDALDDLERTRVSSRRQRAQADDSDAERTVMVDRSGAVSEETVVVDRSGAVSEETVVVDRSGAVSEETVVVDRSGSRAVSEDTVVVDRGSRSDETVVVPRSTPPVGDTDQTAVAPGSGEPAVSRPVIDPSTPVLRTRGDRRRGIAPPPVPAGFAPAPRAAVGPGAVESYPARDLASTATITAAPLGGVDPTRDPSRPIASAARASKRIARISVASFAAACVISVVGLTILVLSIW